MRPAPTQAAWTANPLPGFRLHEILEQHGGVATWRAEREADGARVLVRVADGPAGAALRREAELLGRLALGCALRPLEPQLLEIPAEPSAAERRAAAPRLVLVLEDPGALPLETLLSHAPLEVEHFLPLATAIAAALARVHAAGLVHGGLHGGQVFFAVSAAGAGTAEAAGHLPAEPRAWLTGLGAGWLNEACPGGVELRDLLPGAPPPLAAAEADRALAYAAPERSPRAAPSAAPRGGAPGEAAADHRLDLYALGGLFYHLLVGRPPFAASDPLEQRHAHLAVVPTPPARLRPGVPPALSAIVERLLAKAPEDRYQSAPALLADLERCRALQCEGRPLEAFAPTRNAPARLGLQRQVYGREGELAQLRQAYDRAAAGGSLLVQVAGASGIGKSALVAELAEEVHRRGGHFAGGKFEQLARETPYAGFGGAFRQLALKLLAGSEDEVAGWRARLLDALSPNAQLIVELVPEFEPVLGPQPPVPQLGLTEARIRFNLVLRRFIRSLATRERPLVLFLDDVQWADGASLGLLQLLATDPEAAHLLVVVAYRDSEIAAGGPLALTLAELPAATASLRLELGPLPDGAVRALVAATLGVPLQEAAGLGDVVAAKTGGNPFFVGEFLRTLARRRLLAFDWMAGRWVWDVALVARERITDNVVDLVAARLMDLDAATLGLLQLGACIGSTFDANALARLSGRSVEAVVQGLDAAARAELLLTDADATAQTRPGTTYHFLHDRIEQATYASVPPERRPELHHRVGSLLLTAPAEELETRLFDVVGQLNRATDCLGGPAERRRLAELNLRAARKAKASLAYGAALNLLAFARDLLAADAWEEEPALAFDLYLETAENGYLAGDYATMQQAASVAESHAGSALDAIRVHELLIQYENSSMQYPAAVARGRRALALLGVRLPASPTKLHVGAALLRTKLALAGHDPAELRDMAEMTDPARLATMRVLMLTSSAAYFASPDLFPLLVFRMVRLSVRHGAAALSAFGYVCYGLALCAVLGDVKGGDAYGRLALELVERFGARELQAKVLFLYNLFIGHWSMPLVETVPAFMDGARAGLETGDLEFFSYSLFGHAAHSFFSGAPLGRLSELLRLHRGLAHEHRQEKTDILLQWMEVVLRQLQGEPADAFDEEAALATWNERKDFTSVCYGQALRCLSAYGAGDYRACAESAAVIDRHYDSVMGQAFVPFYRLYQSLALLRLLPELRGGARLRARWIVARNARHLRRSARSAPANYEAASGIVTAERLARRGRFAPAAAALERALDTAAEHGLGREEALAAELLAALAARRGHRERAQRVLEEARTAYLRWGARARALALELPAPATAGGAGAFVRPGPLPAGVAQTTSARPGANGAGGADGADGAGGAASLDAHAMIVAAQAVSAEIEPQRLLRRLLSIALAVAGAQRAVLVLLRGEELWVEAEATGAREEDVLLDAHLLGPADGGAEPVLRLVTRTRRDLALEDAARDGPLAGDAALAAQRVRSVLALPLLRQGQLMGALYLENRLTAGAFAPERIEPLRVLCSQAAVSLENARLYAGLQRSLEAQVELTGAHRRFVPHQFLQALGRGNIVDVRLGDHVGKDLSILFSDVRGFTAMVERMTPRDAIALLNEYLGCMEEPILAAGGFVDNFVGDGVLALFERGPRAAVAAATGMLRALRAFNARRAATGRPPIAIGAGINTGPVVLGTIGGHNRLGCTVIGDAVNLASRIESLTKRYGAAILVGDSTRAGLGDATHLLRPVDRVAVAGRSQPVTLYEVFDEDPPALRDAKATTLPDYLAALDHYYAGRLTEALAAFSACAASLPHDPVLALYRRRCDEHLAAGTTPAADAVERLAQKK